VEVPPLIAETSEEEQRLRDGQERQAERKRRRLADEARHQSGSQVG
jgi:hypothetical protein